MSKKSILAETLQEVKEVKAAIEKNASHVLKSTLKEELEDIIKKGISSSEMGDDDDTEVNPDSTDGMGIDDEPSFGSEPGSEEMTNEPGIGDVPSDELPGDEVIDLTDKSDDEVLKTFELMEPTDQIEIVRTGDGISINFHPKNSEAGSTGGEFGGDPEEVSAEPTGGEEFGDDEFGDENPDEKNPEDDDDTKLSEQDGVMYEIEIDETDEDTVNELDTTEDEGKEMEENKTTSHINALKHKIKPAGQSEDIHEKLVNTRKKLQTLVVENKTLKEELESFKQLKKSFQSNEGEYKEAIKVLKTKLQEVALFTSNLTYAVKLMTENATTKDEKYQILSTLDKAKTINESKQLATTLEEGFKMKKTSSAAKIIEEKVLDKTGGSGASSINESQVYKNPQLERMKELIGRIK